MTAVAEVPIGSIRPHPLNPNVGNVPAIADSLKTNGQYKPILIHQPTSHILAGTHTWKAAHGLGWKTIGGTFINCSDEQALQILLADNRASDAGFTNEDAALTLLQALPDLAGTGYQLEDLKLPESSVEDLFEPTGDGAGQEPAGDAPQAPREPLAATVPLWIGAARGEVEKASFDRWRAGYPKRNPEAFAQVCEELGLVEQDAAPAPQQTPLLDVQVEYIDSLVPYPGNPRQGDIGLITELLKAHGQFRPIVASRNTRRILAGNHVVRAAAALGWETVAVSWVTVDEMGERRIVLADNRTRELADYDPTTLGQALTSVTMEALERTTGYSLEDVQALVSGDTPAKPAARAEATIRIGNIKGRVRLGLLQELNLTPGYELEEVAAVLKLEGVK
ncbi:ParB-like nuclease domain protein [Arthrobacter phage Ottawa]|nr:ParB-like nuclease domain protein [Arthrobacter phage Kharcho]WIC89301.1 ParB-like nuclease domain protein [Arthrobacter phage Ottawa]